MNLADDAWTEFLTELSKEASDKHLKALRCDLLDLFDKQCYVDAAKKALFKPELYQVLKLYLSRVDFDTLCDKMKDHPRNFTSAFGRDKFNHLKLIVRLKKIENDKKPKRGLLAV